MSTRGGKRTAVLNHRELLRAHVSANPEENERSFQESQKRGTPIDVKFENGKPAPDLSGGHMKINKTKNKIAGVPTRGAVDVTRSLRNTGIGAGPIKQASQATGKILRQTARATRS